MGKGGGIANTVGRVGSGILTLGGSEVARKTLGPNNLVSKAFQTPGMILTGGQASGYGGGNGSAANPGIGGPFALDQGQFEGDRAAINAEGDRQYRDTINGLHDVKTANTQRAHDIFAEMLPDIAESANTAHLYDSTGYGQEVARQQSKIASEVAGKEADAEFGALAGKQGFQTGALQRGLSMEDFINQANVAKTIGAQTMPQAPSSKATGLSGGVAGAGAGLPFGPLGSALGGAGGFLLGSNANKRGK